jgi:cytochrome c-type biogenesis protein CcmH/NrfG
VLSVLGYCYYNSGKYQLAAQAYTMLVNEICPDVPEYALYLAECLLKTG